MADHKNESPPTAVGGRKEGRGRSARTPTDSSPWAFVLALAGAVACCAASDVDEFRVKREGPFEFATKPTITRNGDRVTIAFETKALCDVTVAIEEATEKGTGTAAALRSQPPFPRIVRHLVSGALGPNAPAPFKRNTMRQVIVWDGKDDFGTYLDDTDRLTVRVSLGLDPRFERTLLWVPKRRAAADRPLMGAAEEGVYVFNGGSGMDSIILYDHDGRYVRTIYPFARDKIAKVRGIQRIVYPQERVAGREDATTALKTNFLQSTMLTSGTSGGFHAAYRGVTLGHPTVSARTAHWAMYGKAANAMDVRASRIALAHVYLNRLGAAGATDGLPLHGPKTSITHGDRKQKQNVPPYSTALSPDGKWLYLTGYHFGYVRTASQDLRWLDHVNTLPVVMRLDLTADKPMTVFKGAADVKQAGSDNDHFTVPAGVEVDERGRVYVADYINNRVQVYGADGRYLKTIKAYRPAHVAVHRKTGQIYVWSWRVYNQHVTEDVKRVVVHYGPFDDPREIERAQFAPQDQRLPKYRMCPVDFVAELDSWSDPVRFWLAEPWGETNVLTRGKLRRSGIEIREWRDGALKTVHTFNRDVQRARVPVAAPRHYRQRLYVNPKNGRCYVAEGTGSAVGKSFRTLFELDPETGRMRIVEIPFDAEDMAFGLDGRAYLRSVNVLVRYDPETWREVPWDYGVQRERVAFGWMSGTRRTHAVSGLLMPADGNWHHGGMAATPQGHVVVACGLNISMQVRTTAKYVHRGKKYTPTVYPGRLMGGRAGATTLHVWDERGRLLHEDVAPGLGDLYGIGMDRDHNLYLMSAATRVLDGKRYVNAMTGTLAKFPAERGRVLVRDGAKVPLPKSDYPDRPIDVVSAPQGPAWFKDAEWLYGGVGYGGKNPGNGCACWNARFDLDEFARSFAPEVDRYRVAVLDKAGNLILRIGRYGNVDDGKPLVENGGPAVPRSVGGDEVALYHAPYLATHTDRRLFIADPGNGRILSVRLGYHATERVNLKDVHNGGS